MSQPAASVHLPACVWQCGNQATSGEDLIPKWAAGAVPIPGPIVGHMKMHMTHNGHTYTPRKVQKLATDYWKARIACKECNTRWMSAIENRVKPTIVPLIKGYRRTLGQAEQLDIASWACMKAVLVDAAGARLATDEVRSCIFEQRHRTSFPRLPVDMAVSLAAFNEPATLGVWTPLADGIGSARQRLAQWVTTFMIGHLVVQVVGRAGSVLPSVLQQAPGGIHDGCRFTVWPPQVGPVDWPTHEVLNRSQIPDFLVAPAPLLVTVEEPLSPPEPCGQCEIVHDPITRDLPVPEADE